MFLFLNIIIEKSLKTFFLNYLFELFRGGLLVEVQSPEEAKIAEQSGAVAIILDMSASPIHLDANTKTLEKILSFIRIPILSPFRPGHFVEAELLMQMGFWGVYADSRYESILTTNSCDDMKDQNIPILADVTEENINVLPSISCSIPVIRGENIELIIEKLKFKSEVDLIFVAGPIETLSDIALLRRSGADAIILPKEIFHDQKDIESHLSNLTNASLHFDNTSKLAKILERSYEE